jgi:hypothetical protein
MFIFIPDRLKFFPEFPGRQTFLFKKNPVEIGEALKPATVTDIRNRLIGFSK